MRISSIRGLLASAACSLCAVAHAGLGDTPDSLRQQSVRLQASIQTSSRSAYDLLEMQASRTTIRQYVDRRGSVFAVSWSAPGPVDMREILGSHYDRYLAASARLVRRDLHHSALILPDLVVEVSGSAHHFAGRAYLPAGLPAGVVAAEIR